jgi:site-specific DNA-cytosine methylase
MKEIKKYCIKHNITDILVRPLTVSEMLKIQGFPDWYRLTGTMTAQKKHIGNSVEVKVGVALFQAIDRNIQQQYKLAA